MTTSLLIRLARTRSALIAAGCVLLAATALRLADPAFLVSLRELTFDTYQRLRPAERAAQPVRVADIDEASLAAIGQWPWPRSRLADLTDRLTALGAAAVAFDIVFAEPDRTAPARLPDLMPASADESAREALRQALALVPDPDAAFAEALARAPSVVAFAVSGASGRWPARRAGVAFAGADPAPILPPMAGATPSLPELEAAARGIGGLSLSARDSTGTVRRVPLLFSDGQKVYPALAVEALRVGLGASSIKVRATGASGESATGRPAVTSLQVGREAVPLTGDGELWLRYGHDTPDLYVSVADVFDAGRAEALRPKIEGHIVLVGTSAAGLQDLRGTALGEVVPGVSIHAQAIEQMLARDFLTRPDWADGLEIVFGIGVGLAFVLPLALLGAPFALAVGAVAASAALGLSWWAFRRHGLLLDAVFPLATGLMAYLAAAVQLYMSTDRERRFVRGAFAQYLAPDLVARLERSPATLRLGGETREVTVLFMDVRGFTTLSETLSPDAIVTFLNTLLSPLSDAIQTEQGTIDKYIGDSIMAFWNAPLTVPDHAAAACRAALAMRAALARLNEEGVFAALGIHEAVRIGIGLNTGQACIGNMGSARRFNYSAVGDAVNIAARIESASKEAGCDILASEATRAAAPDFDWSPIGTIALKGRVTSVALHALTGPSRG